MKVTAAMIEFVLRSRGMDARVVGEPDCAIEAVYADCKGKREAGGLYVMEAGKTAKRLPKNAPYALLEVKGSADSPHTPLEEASRALRALDVWDAELKDALLKRVSLAAFVRLGATMLRCPIAYFDRDLITLASSDDYWERDDGSAPDAGGLRVSGQMPSSRAVDLVDDLDYLNAAEKHEPFYYENAQNRIFLGINTFDEGEYLARLVLALSPGQTALHPGEEQLAVHFHRYLDDLHTHFAGNVDVVSSQNDALHALCRASLVEGRISPDAEAESILRSFGWAGEDELIVSKLVFFEGVHWDTISLYLCGLLERAVSASCAFPVERQIIWLVNLTRSAKPGESRARQMERITDSLVSIMRDYACKTGMSSTFTTLAKARSHFLEAEQALAIGQVRHPHYWYYRFSDYAFDYLLAKSTEDLPGELLCHPALTTLMAHDAAHGTEYARTLVCFLRNSQNTTHAADELFIHRTSFMRRMGHMRTLVAIDFDDPDEVLHLLLSAKLLGL